MTSLFGAVGGALGGIFGGVNNPAPQINYTPPGFTGGGLTTSFNGNNYSVSPTADRTAAVGGVASTYGQQANDIAGLRSTVTPGFSQMRTTALADLDNQRTSALGNLRDNLAQRRILGSSFATDALSRADQDYQQQRQNTIATSFMNELQANQQLIQQQYTAARGSFQTGLDELNLEAGLASTLTGQATSVLANVATTQTQLDAFFQANKAQFWAGTGAMAGKGIGQVAQMAMAA
jgi:hypothetical protein